MILENPFFPRCFGRCNVVDLSYIYGTDPIIVNVVTEKDIIRTRIEDPTNIRGALPDAGVYQVYFENEDGQIIVSGFDHIVITLYNIDFIEICPCVDFIP